MTAFWRGEWHDSVFRAGVLPQLGLREKNMAKRGRPAKSGKRHPCGKLKQPSRSDPPGIANIYVIQCGFSGPVKIGKSVNPAFRMGGLQVSNPEDLYFRWCGCGNADEIIELEKEVHAQLRRTSLHKRGEWYHISANTAINFVCSVASSLGVQIKANVKFFREATGDLAKGA